MVSNVFVNDPLSKPPASSTLTNSELTLMELQCLDHLSVHLSRLKINVLSNVHDYFLVRVSILLMCFGQFQSRCSQNFKQGMW